MLGDSNVLGSSGDVMADAGAHGGGEADRVALNSGEEDKGRGDECDQSFGGNRWPKQETVALLKVRAEMDEVFRDSTAKGPLWEEVSRKLAGFGYHRSAKKCKEKFENVYKYHRRTKEGRTGKPKGKTYRFFDQLEAFENQHPSLPTPQTPVGAKVAMPVANPLGVPQITVPLTTHPVSMTQNIFTLAPAINLSVPSLPRTNHTNPSQSAVPSSFPNMSAGLMSNSSSYSTSSDEELEGRGKRKRKWEEFFEGLMKQVIDKREELQKKLLEAIVKREQERMVREEAWRIQEISRINREREILAQQRSIAAAKDAAVMAFLQKIAEQQKPAQGHSNLTQQQAPQPAPPLPQLAPAPLQPTPPSLPLAPTPLQPTPHPQLPQPVKNLDTPKTDNGDNLLPASSSRWPKVEVEALIKLRNTLDSKYQENGPKGPLWEEISAAMRKLDYNRSAKRCKEKWENINKYYKKVKESNKKRPEDSKTCPYFYQLDALYKGRNKIDSSSTPMKPENMMAPIMVRPEQQWPPPPQQEPRADSGMEDIESENLDQNQEDEDKDGDDEEGDGGDYEIVANKQASIGAVE